MNLASYIDHTLLKPDATAQHIESLCQEAEHYGFASVCIAPYWIEHARHLLQREKVKICTVIGFPLGFSTSFIKAKEAAHAIALGAQELDMVLAIGKLKSGDLNAVRKDITGVVQAAGSLPVKVILETCLLTQDEIKTACLLSMEAGAAFVKTSTGFSKSGATLEDVRLMRQMVGPSKGVKASGGIRDRKTALAMIEAGANRLGTSAGVAIMQASLSLNEAASIY